MKLTSSSVTIIFWTIVLLVVARPSHQYVYSCNPSASCGCSSSPASLSRIVGGESAGTNTWSWAVSLSISGTSLCSGSIISSFWVITAAHCVSGVAPSKVTVYAGSNVRFSGQSRVGSKIVVHPNYDSSTKVNDIALIQLNTPLSMSGSIKSICIPSVSSARLAAGEWPPVGLYVVAVGWGRLSEDGSLPTVLQQVTLETIGYRVSTCRSVINDPQKQFCAGVPGGGKDTCQGDSGGPLMMFTASGQWELVGVTSYGIGCAEASYSGVYTRVAAYQNWIATTTSGGDINPISSDAANINPLPSRISSGAIKTSAVPHLPFLLFSLIFIIFNLS